MCSNFFVYITTTQLPAYQMLIAYYGIQRMVLVPTKWSSSLFGASVSASAPLYCYCVRSHGMASWVTANRNWTVYFHFHSYVFHPCDLVPRFQSPEVSPIVQPSVGERLPWSSEDVCAIVLLLLLYPNWKQKWIKTRILHICRHYITV